MPVAHDEDFLDFALLSQFSLNKIQDWITWINAAGDIVYVNEAAYTALGYTKEEIYQLKIFDIDLSYTPEIWAAHLERLKALGSRTFETKHRKKDGQSLPVEINSNYIEYRGQEYNCAIVRPIVERKRAETREHIKNHVLDLVAHNAPLKSILAYLVRGVEEENPERLCSILLLDKSKQFLKNYVAPSLPAGYSAAIENLKVGPNIGSCGTAAFEGKPVFVENIQTDPRWEGYKQLAADYELASCWSVPIIVDHNDVVGTFGIYHKTPKTPSAADIEQLEYLSNLARIAIERHRTAEELRLSDSIFKNTSEAMLVLDINGIIIATNPAFTKISGYTSAEVVGHHPVTFGSPRHDQDFYDAIRKDLHENGSWRGEICGIKKTGEEYINWVTVNTTNDDKGRPFRRVVLFSDITEKKKHEERIWYEANYDALTHLPNRRLFQERLQQEVLRANRLGTKVILLYLDLDGFKEVNDALGHQGGDQLLIEVARRLNEVIRVTDCTSRLGGDEFTVTLVDVREYQTAIRVATSILELLQAPIMVDTHATYISASIGVTVYPDDATDASSLIKNADQAMYEAKKSGRNQYSFYTQEMQLLANRRTEQKRELRHALLNNEFQIYYQPVVDLKTGNVTKAEALIRWQHCSLGMVSPAEFIPLAEETGLIHEIGSWVLIESLAQVLKWRTRFHPDFQISVNLSPTQFKNTTYFDRWFTLLDSTADTSNCLCVEITEGVLLDASQKTAKQLMRFREAGIEVAIDDFGTGYSSLAYIKRIDVDYLKIDRTFITNIAAESTDFPLVEAIIMMAHKLGLKVIAEGVETEAQLALLNSMGCDYIQGYFYSKPLPQPDFEAWLLARKS
ncbi:MAG TPA: EAL domain-containing protein [Methylophilus sp.]|uniref:bifunctional diguanylate cyclase/phosphodiesterase n=1 Tax=Methylophilus sp. TaxID=29541 RepID=UPI002CD532F0|nr:EAL domain-containing protein [Methylophilus sp.]HSH87624.1 EAL domain-containing protein [Methylophilus sp.]